MAKISIAGSAVIITSDISLDNLKLIQKYRPQALSLKDEEGKTTLFAIATGESGSVTKYGAIFNSFTRDADKKATITIMKNDLPAEADKAKAEIADEFGTALNFINKLEALLPAVVEEINTEHAAIMAAIDVQ